MKNFNTERPVNFLWDKRIESRVIAPGHAFKLYVGHEAREPEFVSRVLRYGAALKAIPTRVVRPSGDDDYASKLPTSKHQEGIVTVQSELKYRSIGTFVQFSFAAPKRDAKTDDDKVFATLQYYISSEYNPFGKEIYFWFSPAGDYKSAVDELRKAEGAIDSERFQLRRIRLRFDPRDDKIPEAVRRQLPSDGAPILAENLMPVSIKRSTMFKDVAPENVKVVSISAEIVDSRDERILRIPVSIFVPK